MLIKTVPHSTLTIWTGNPRPEASIDERAEMKASLANVGQLMPIIARPTATGHEVIAGQNRCRSIGELIAQGIWDDKKGVIIEERDVDDATALEIATSENISITMHPMHQFEAFSRLVEMGRSITDIANGYGVTSRIVEQRLSYAKLEDGARTLVKENQRDLDWASAMTMASPAEQRQILDEINAEPRRYRTSHEVRSRLQDQLVSLENALFDLDDVDAAIVRRDLFDPADRRYMKQSDFIPLQDAALQQKVAERRAEGWASVCVLNDRDYDPYRYQDGITEKEKAQVIFVRYPNGDVIEHAGITLRHEERVNDIEDDDEQAAAAIFGDDEQNDIATSAIRDEIAETEERDEYAESPKTRRLIEAERAAIVQKMVLEDSRLALITTIAGCIGSSAARPLQGGSDYADLTLLDPQSIARKAIEAKNDAVNTVFRNRGVDITAGYGELLASLGKLTDDELMLVFQVELARKMSTGLNKIDKLYDHLGEMTNARIADNWGIDRTFLGTLSVSALKGLANRILPERLRLKIGKSKNDMIETIAQIAEDAREDGGRLDHSERAELNSWAPPALQGAPAADNDNPFVAANDTDEDDEGDAALFA